MAPKETQHQKKEKNGEKKFLLFRAAPHFQDINCPNNSLKVNFVNQMESIILVYCHATTKNW